VAHGGSHVHGSLGSLDRAGGSVMEMLERR
jgi:hypothetical protein